MITSVQQHGDWFAVLSGGEPVRTPMGTPMVSRHRALAEEVAADVARWGSDPTAKTTTFSLQASYLDFGLRVRREVLEENTAAIWPDDLFVQRPTEPRLAAALERLWGPVDGALDRARLREALRAIPLRQLVALMTAGQVLRSAVLGREVVTSGRDLAALARGACGRHFEAVVRSLGLAPDPRPRRHVPTDLDEELCARCCAALGGEAEASFPGRCALVPLLEKLRRWASYAEEVEKR
jgi:hypothetical protein